MSTVSCGTSMQASSRSDEAPVNELTFNESKQVASGLSAACNWKKLKGVDLRATRGLDPPPHHLPHQEIFFRHPCHGIVVLPSSAFSCFAISVLLIPDAGRAFGRLYAGSRLWGRRLSSFLGILSGEISLKKIGVLSSQLTTATSCCSLYPYLAVVAG